jgi:O-antigen/teichoic acid export membrane protein
MTTPRVAEEKGAPGHTTHRTAWNAAVRSVGEIAGKVATLAWTVLAARALTQDEFGSFSYAMNVMILVSALPAWGFDTMMVRRGSQEPSRLADFFAVVLSWRGSLALLVFSVTAAVVLPQRPSPSTALVFVLVLVAGLPEMWSDSSRAAASARQSQGGISAALVAQRVLTAAAICVVLLLGGGVVPVAVAFLAGTVAGLGLHYLAVHRLGIAPRWRSVSPTSMRRFARGTGLIGLSAVLGVVLFRADTVILEAFQGDAAVAVYTTAYRLMETVLFVAWAVNQAVLPVLSSSESRARARTGLARGLGAVSFVYLPFAAVSLTEAQPIILLLFGERYAQHSAPVLACLAFAPLLFATAFLGSAPLVARGRMGAVLLGTVVAATVNIGSNLLLIPLLGPVGAAVSTVLAYGVQAALVLGFLWREIHLRRLLRPYAESAAAAVLLALTLVVLPGPLVLQLAVGGVVYLVAWFVLARRFAPEQVQVLRRLVPGVRG